MKLNWNGVIAIYYVWNGANGIGSYRFGDHTLQSLAPLTEGMPGPLGSAAIFGNLALREA